MIAITRFLPRSHDFLTISHDFLRSAARLAVAVLAALLIAAPSISEAMTPPPSWVWLFSSNFCSYYLDRNHVWVDDSAIYHYTIKTVYVADSARQSRMGFLSRLAPYTDFSDFYFDIATYDGYTGTNPPALIRHPKHLYCYRSDGSYITGFRGKAGAYITLGLGGVDAIVDAKARSWAVYRPDD